MEMELEHISHPHPMMVRYLDETHYDGAVPSCDGCLLPLSGALYICNQYCEFFLHKSCAELPNNIIHFLHPKHPLTLLPKTPYISGRAICSNCSELVWGFDYHCSICQFDLCIQCLCLLPQQIVESEGHEHSFKLHRPIPFPCDACGKISNAISCLCTTCLLLVHKSCASLPTTIKHIGHEHPLSLIHSIQLNDPMDDSFLCNACGEDVDKCYWCYYCASCPYVAHLGCATSASASVPNECTIDLISNDLNEISLTKIDNDHVNEVSLAQIERVKELRHFSHQQYSLTLSNDEPDSEEVCDGCVQTISAPFYSCAQCNYFLHVSCAELPHKIQHLLHPHSLTLFVFPKLFICDACHRVSNGLAYGCKNCEFYIDLKCTLFSSTLRHEAHEHTLSLNQKGSKSKCDACGVTCKTKFRCEACDFNLDFRCAALPSTVRHKWDSHPFKLTFSMPFVRNEDKRLGKYYCDFCEERRTDPNHWFYYCEDCDNAVHPECLLGIHMKIKFGRRYGSVNCPHLLTLVKNTWLPNRSGDFCDHRKEEYGMFLLECVDCDVHEHLY